MALLFSGWTLPLPQGLVDLGSWASSFPQAASPDELVHLFGPGSQLGLLVLLFALLRAQRLCT